MCAMGIRCLHHFACVSNASWHQCACMYGDCLSYRCTAYELLLASVGNASCMFTASSTWRAPVHCDAYEVLLACVGITSYMLTATSPSSYEAVFLPESGVTTVSPISVAPTTALQPTMAPTSGPTQRVYSSIMKLEFSGSLTH